MESQIIELKKKTGERVTYFINLLELNSSQFSKLIGLPPSTLYNIENGKGFNSNSIGVITFYLGIPIHLFFDFSQQFDDAEKLIAGFWENVKVNQNEYYQEFKAQESSLVDLIKGIILDDIFFKTPKTTKEIANYIKEHYSRDFGSSTISQGLINAVNMKMLKSKKIGKINKYYK